MLCLGGNESVVLPSPPRPDGRPRRTVCPPRCSPTRNMRGRRGLFTQCVGCDTQNPKPREWWRTRHGFLVPVRSGCQFAPSAPPRALMGDGDGDGDGDDARPPIKSRRSNARSGLKQALWQPLECLQRAYCMYYGPVATNQSTAQTGAGFMPTGASDLLGHSRSKYSCSGPMPAAPVAGRC